MTGQSGFLLISSGSAALVQRLVSFRVGRDGNVWPIPRNDAAEDRCDCPAGYRGGMLARRVLPRQCKLADPILA